jgi:Ca2+-binding EF-hand superfamily protein
MRIKVCYYNYRTTLIILCSDGYITTQELEMAMSKCGVYPSKLELRLVMTQGDADGNIQH